MSFKIDSTRPTVPVSRPATEPAGSRSGTATPTRSSDDSVRLTGSGLLAQELNQAVANAPDVDAQRVAETRTALAEGRYTVDPQQVAAKMMRLEWELHAT